MKKVLRIYFLGGSILCPKFAMQNFQRLPQFWGSPRYEIKIFAKSYHFKLDVLEDSLVTTAVGSYQILSKIEQL
jgi:hypothetical protein